MTDNNKIVELLSGNEKFMLNGSETTLTVKDFWQFQFSNLMDSLGFVAEFLVAKALNKDKPENSIGWTVYDLEYCGKRIEVKTTSYYHSFNPKDFASEQRVFSIRKTHVGYKQTETELARQNDIYVFCVDVGRSKESANPLNLDNWRFYVVPTAIIDKYCKDQKTVSLKRIQKITGLEEGITYDRIKQEVDYLIKK